MIKTVVKDTFFLSRPSLPAGKDDLDTARDLADTLRANQAVCVGMAANMIGVNKRIIVFFAGPILMIMLNPVITAKRDPYTAYEGCLSLSGQRPAARFRNITVSFQDLNLAPKTMQYSGHTAQIIQHEIDHCDGILI